MKKGLLYIFLLVCLGLGISHGQNDFFFNHYMFNPSYFNPAWTGMEDQAFVAAHHRTQWAGYDATFDPGGAPTTQMVSFVLPVNGKIAGFGMTMVNDKTGPLSSLQARLSATTSFSTNQGDLFIGLMPSINTLSSNTDYWRFSQTGDDVIQGLIENGFNEILFNFHIGVVFNSNRDYFVGVSVENVLEPKYSFSNGQENKLQRNFNLLAGKPVGISRDLILRPTLLLRSDLNSYSLDLSGILEYQDRMWGGVAFRRSESLGVLLGYSFLEGGRLKAGYSFDYVIQNQDAKEPTSHEVFVRYGLPNLVFGGRKAVKTPRFAF